MYEQSMVFEIIWVNINRKEMIVNGVRSAWLITITPADEINRYCSIENNLPGKPWLVYYRTQRYCKYRDTCNRTKHHFPRKTFWLGRQPAESASSYRNGFWLNGYFPLSFILIVRLLRRENSFYLLNRKIKRKTLRVWPRTLVTRERWSFDRGRWKATRGRLSTAKYPAICKIELNPGIQQLN